MPTASWPDDPAGAVAEWARTRLIVPPGHPLSGQPMELPAFFVDWLREALAPGIREALLSVGRKNAKSQGIAVLLLAALAEDGPLRGAGTRIGVCSITSEKAGELWLLAKDTAEASKLEGVEFMRSPRSMRSQWGSAAFLSGDKSAGQASGFGPWIVVDEIGLLKERDRELVSQMLASVSARDGRMLAISVMGGSPLTQELVDRRDDPAVVVHTYQAPAKCDLDDPAAWALANPGLGTIKSLSYMADMARRAKMLPAERSAFLTYDLNRPTTATQDMIAAPEELGACEVERLPRRTGKCWLGLDLGNTLSMSAAFAVWDNGRAEYLAAWGDKPSLADRGQVDGVGALYELAEKAGELVTFDGAAVDPGEFLAAVLDWLAGEKVECCAFDTYKAAAIQLELDNAPGIRWPTYVTQRTRRGASHRSSDIDRFRLAVLQGRLAFAKPNLLLSSAVARSHVHVGADNLAELRKATQRSRIDVLSAGLLAVGARDSRPVKRSPSIRVVA